MPKETGHNTAEQVRRWRTRRHEKAADTGPAVGKLSSYPRCQASALTRLEAALRFVDDVKAATTANDLIVAVAFFQCFQ